MTSYKVKKGWETLKFYGWAGKEKIVGKPWGDLSQKQLKAIVDGDPKNTAQVVDVIETEQAEKQPKK